MVSATEATGERDIRVLLVEDRREDVQRFERALARGGHGRFRSRHAGGLAAAITLLERENFDILVLDLSLPECEGIETFFAVRDAAPDHPVVVVTSAYNDELATRLVKEGAQDVLLKGEFSGTALARCLRHAVERRDAQRELEEAQEAALAASRAKSEFVAAVSHEIRTPLHTILGMSELLLGMELPPEQAEYVRIVSRSGQSLFALINAVLDFAQIESGTLTLRHVPFGIRSVVESCCEILAFDAHKKGLVLVGRVASDVPDGLEGDPGRIRQVLVNLLGNAVKFTERGYVRVDVQRGSEAQTLEIRVSDTGIGIPEAKQARIFDSFTQADGSVTREYGGTGLGLTISTRLVAAMGGTLDVESAPGAGSTFRVRIPLHVAQASGVEERPPLPPPGLRALVVDDQELERETVAEHLGHWGLEVELAASGAEGLERATKADREGRPFDLVFVDCRMPGMNGFALFERLARELQSAARVVMMLTTDHRRGDIQLCADAGLGGYLLKPVKETALRELVLAMTTDRESSAPDAAERELPWIGQRSLRVLLAEDSNDNQLLVRAYLRDTPHELRVVENGLEAVEACRREVFDVVLMDVQMPVQDGLSATREIRAFERRIGRRPTPIIALTANAFEGESEASRAAGCDAHVTKPISRKRLVELLTGNALPPRDDPPRRRLMPSEDVAELLPGYLENRQQELPRLFDALEGRDFEPIRIAGHNLKGTGAAYGCPELSEIGARLEAAARLANGDDVEEGLLAIGELLKSFEIVPAPGVGSPATEPVMEEAT